MNKVLRTFYHYLNIMHLAKMGKLPVTMAYHMKLLK